MKRRFSFVEKAVDLFSKISELSWIIIILILIFIFFIIINLLFLGIIKN